MKEKCSGRVWHGAGLDMACIYNGIVQEDGKHWCRRHTPSRVAARHKAAKEKREAECAAMEAKDRKHQRIREAEAAVLEAAEKWVDCDGVGIAGRLVKAVAKLRDARKAAE